MNDRFLLVAGLFVLVAVVCIVAASLVPKVRRILWIVGLSLASLEFGGLAVGIAIRGISRRHLSGHGFEGVLLNGFAAWMTIQYLIFKIRARGVDPLRML